MVDLKEILPSFACSLQIFSVVYLADRDGTEIQRILRDVPSGVPGSPNLPVWSKSVAVVIQLFPSSSSQKLVPLLYITVLHVDDTVIDIRD